MFLNRLVGACILLVTLGTSVAWGQTGGERGSTPALPEVVAVIFADLHSAPSAEVDGLLDELAKARHLNIQKLFKRDLAEAQGLGVKIRPTVFLDGTRFEGLDALRSLVRGGVAPTWESLPVETLQLDLISTPISGPPDAPVTLIEFTDFHCGFCQIHSQTLSQLTAAYPGKIRRIFKHYPQMEGSGLMPHLACIQALDQGKFWELHEALMATPIAEGQPSVLERAQSVGIGADAFQQAISDPRARALVQRDSAEGERLGIRATPTTFLNGRRLVGRQSLEGLKRYVDAILSVSNAAAAPVVAGATPKTAVASLLASPALVKHARVPQEETCCGGDFASPTRARSVIDVRVTQPSGPLMNSESK